MPLAALSTYPLVGLQPLTLGQVCELAVPYTSVLIRQAERMGRIQQICGLSWTNVLEAEIVSLIHHYNVEPGVSEITAQLAH